MWRLFYNIVLLVVSPVIVAVLLAKRRCRRGLLQRLGLENSLSGLSGPSCRSDQPDRPNEPDRLDRPARPVIWIHAVSLGEVVAVTPLVNELHRRHPAYRLVVSTVTETGREAVEQRLAGVADHCYAPLDFPCVVSRFIDQLQPRLYVFVETELWPNLLWHLRRRGVPTALVNGRLSTRSFARQQWAPVRSFYRTMLQTLSLCLMQSDRDVDRIIALGAEASRVRRTGNIKFDQPIPAVTGGEWHGRILGFRRWTSCLWQAVPIPVKKRCSWNAIGPSWHSVPPQSYCWLPGTLNERNRSRR